jgi:menaquinone-specific isochorismate synthase
MGDQRVRSKTQRIQAHVMNRSGRASDFVSLGPLFELLAVGQQRLAASSNPVLVSHTQPFPTEVDPIRLFAAARQLDSTTNYWSLPVKMSWIVGVGEAAEIAAEGPLRFKRAITAVRDMTGSAVVEANGGPGPVFLGGFRFRSGLPTDGPWEEFHDGLLTLPRWMIVSQSNDQRWVTINVVLSERSDDDGLQEELATQARALFDAPGDSPEPMTASVEVQKVEDGWRQNVEQALGAIKNGKLAKVTLARKLTLHSEGLMVPEVVLRSLTANYPECHAFAFCRGGACFVGASPEELASLNGTSVTSTCLAGSAPRGDSESKDIEFADWLLKSVKERREHEVVVDWVSERMRRLCSKLQWNDVPYVLRLGNLQHLATHFVGTPKDGCHILDFVEALHPTPAVGGIPLKPALEMIGRLEDFDRGWYTGPIGWVDRYGNGEFAIAIRCALLRGDEAFLYAGDGIVSGSYPDLEDQETKMKFKPLLTALGAS